MVEEITDGTGDTDSNPPDLPDLPPVRNRPSLVLPASLLTVETAEEAVAEYCAAGLKPILIHAPTDSGGCTCGKAHGKSKNGSSSVGKHPIAKNWAKGDFSIEGIRDHLARLSFEPNVGMVLGRQLGVDEYILAVDIDDLDRGAKLETELGPLPETARCDSGRGYRLFFTVPPEIDVKRLVNVAGVGGEPGVDVKVEGGQVVVAPSLHANGKRYVWTRVGAIAQLPVHWGTVLVTEPELPKIISQYTPKTLSEDRRARTRVERWLEAAVHNEARALAACTEGMRNNTLYAKACMLFEKCAGVYLGHKWQWIYDEMLSAAKACGLGEGESRKTLDSADRKTRESGKVRQPVWLADPAPATADGSSPESSPSSIPPSQQVRERRPTIRISTELHTNVLESVKALRTDDNMYQRSGRLVSVTKVSKTDSEQSPTIDTDDSVTHRQLVEGSPQIQILTRAVIKGRLSKFAIFQKWVESSGGYKNVLPTDDIVGHIHDEGHWPGIRTLTGITETPTFGANGTIAQRPGYDPDTGYLYIPSGHFPEVKDERTSQEDARWAFGMLNGIFSDFPYVNASHRSVPVAAIMTLIARPAINGSIPAVLFDASTRGSGKTLQTDAIAMIATGRGAPRMNYTIDEVELEKILAGYALKGSSFICLDNVPAMRPFGGGPIDRCITARDEVDLRVLGKSHVPTLPWRALIMATGNNMALFGDTSRRVLMARLEPQEESPERRTTFKHQDLLEFIRVQRPRLVGAALLILRAYWRAGRPDMGCARWGSFEEWSRLIPHAIVFAGGADPMLARPERDEDVDVETQALSCLLDQLPMLHAKLVSLAPGSPTEGVAARHIISALYEQVPEWSEFEALRDAIEVLCKPKGRPSPSKPDATTLGYKLRAMRSRVVGGRKLVARNGNNHITLWHVSATT